jgi:hypothetical protein
MAYWANDSSALIESGNRINPGRPSHFLTGPDAQLCK